MKIEKIDINKLLPYIHNAKDHPKKQIDKIKRSIEEFGFNLPILIDDKNEIISGHGRLLALQDMGVNNVPCIRVKHLSEEQIKAFRIVRLRKVGGFRRCCSLNLKTWK